MGPKYGFFAIKKISKTNPSNNNDNKLPFQGCFYLVDPYKSERFFAPSTNNLGGLES